MQLLRVLSLSILLVMMSISVKSDGIEPSMQNVTEKSNFELAAEDLGLIEYKQISAKTHQEAFLSILQLAGYLNCDSVWQDMLHLDKAHSFESGIDLAFSQVCSAITKSRAHEAPEKFNVKILRRELNKITALSTQDIKDLLLYISQHAFQRQLGQERHELKTQEWMNKYRGRYIKAASTLQMISRHEPECTEYDAVWIAGAARVGLITRIVDLHYMLAKYGITRHGNISVLAGNRPIWAEIDGITPAVYQKLTEAFNQDQNLDEVDITGPMDNIMRVNEGKEYMLSLAKRNNIALNQTSPLIRYTNQKDCPEGYFINRWYPNYKTTETRRLTETLMSYDALRMFFPDSSHSFELIDTQAKQNRRPDTYSTAYDGAVRFIKRNIYNTSSKTHSNNKKNFTILLISNNPYIERQTLATQRGVDKALSKYGYEQDYTITVEGVGRRCQQEVKNIHSELAALIAERWKKLQNTPDSDVYRPMAVLMYQTRNHTNINTPMPKLYPLESKS